MEWSRSDTSDDLWKKNVPSRHWEFERRSQRRPHVASRCRELVVSARASHGVATTTTTTTHTHLSLVSMA